jgi:serine/threonine protein kinase/WD40 repeat protein
MSERTVFLAALDIDDAAERSAYLDRACAGDPALRAQVEQLLAEHERPGIFMDRPAPDRLAATMDHRPPAEGPGTLIGPYRLMEQIGEGGMGLVFVAEQQHPVRRRVALKLIKPGMDTREVVARFEAERQALALMEHPHIARVLDAGVTDRGRPFFVMELVRGIPVTDYCDQGRLGIRERLGLFVQVCQAVQHAHQKGVIHRDLKPSNVLVTEHDGTPVAKVIDFGVAKAVGRHLTEKTVYTRFLQLVGTPMYMSPEQAGLSGLDVDTRADIYALGVLLYELLTGTTPFDAERLRRAGYDEVRRIIREEEPARPSTRLSTLGAAAATVSGNRRCDPGRLSRLMRRELDWVVMKCLEKDRGRRYESASTLAADVQRYLRDEPVQACPPSAAYRLRRFVRRYKGPVLAAALVVLALVGGIIGTTGALFRATEAQADAVREAHQKAEALRGKEAALADAKEKLFLALVSQARAARGSGRVGQRFETLRAVRQAAQIRTTPELRTEATAALVLPDAEVAHEWESWPRGSATLGFDADFRRYARLDRQGGLTVCRRTGGREKVLFRLPAHGKPPFYNLLLSADGQFVGYAHARTRTTAFAGYRVWSLGPEPAVVPLDEPTDVNEGAAAFHPNSRQLALGHSDGTVSVYDLATGRRLRRFTVRVPPMHLAFQPRGGRLAVACGNAVQLFDADTGRELPALRQPAGTGATAVAWHPDGRRLAVGCGDRKIHIWDTEAAAEVMPPWAGHTAEGLGGLAFNHGGDRLISHDWSGQARLWDAATGRMLLTMPGALGFQFSPDDRLLGPGVRGNKVRLYRLAPGRELRVLRRRGADRLETINCPVVHPDGRTLAASGRDWLNFFDLVSGEALASVRLPYRDAADPVFFDPLPPTHRRAGSGTGQKSGGWVTGGPGGVFVWPAGPDPARPDVLRVGPARQLARGVASPYARGTSASKDGRVVAVPLGHTTVLLHRDHPEGGRMLGRQYDVRFSAVSPDGRWVVTCSHWRDGHSRSARVWDADTGRQVRELPLEGSTQALFSPDGRWLLTATAGDGCRLWQVRTWRPVRRFEGYGCFSPDSRLLALGDVFSVIRLVETATGREVARLSGPEPLWYAPACFTLDGTRLIASSSGADALYAWDLRLIRRQLKELALDWQWPEFPPPDLAGKAAAPSRVEILLGELARPTPTSEERARRAIDHYRRAVAANPNDARACNDLAWLYLTAPGALRDVKAALPLAERAARLEPANALHRNTLGVAYYRAGRFREAADTLRANLAAQKNWGLPFDLYFLAMSYHRLGEAGRARDFFAWAVRWQHQQKGLAPGHVEELRMFRAEAEQVLGLGKSKKH